MEEFKPLSLKITNSSSTFKHDFSLCWPTVAQLIKKYWITKEHSKQQL